MWMCALHIDAGVCTMYRCVCMSVYVCIVCRHWYECGGTQGEWTSVYLIGEHVGVIYA